MRVRARHADGREWTVDLTEGPPPAGSELRRYSGILPLDGLAGDTLRYSIVATDGSLAANETQLPAAGEFGLALRPGRFLDLDLDDGGLDVVGEWEWGTPEGVDAPDRVWATRLSGPYANSSRSILQWGPIDISQFETARLEFDHFYRFVRGSDGGRVEASNDGRSWRVLSPAGGYTGAAVAAFEGAAYTGNSNAWEHALFPLDRSLGSQLWIRWVMASDDVATDLGWYLDDLTVLAAQARIAPGSLRAVSGEDGAVPLTWSAPRGIEIPSDSFVGYRIYRAGPGEEFVHLGDVSSPEYVDLEVENEVTYRYRVHAVYTEGESPAVEVSATPAAPIMAFSVRSVSYTLRGGISESDTTFFVRNLGQGTLQFDTFVGEEDWSIDDARIDLPVPPAGDPEVIVWSDPADAPGSPDLARIGVSHRLGSAQESILRLRLEGHFPWGDPTQSWGGVFLIDTDGNVGTRPESFGFGWSEDLNIGWEHAVVFGSLARELGSDRPALLFDADRLDRPTQLEDTDFPESGREISFGIPLAFLGDPERVQLATVFARSREADPFERAPELPDITWLKREPRHGRARLGQPQPFSFEFDAREIGSGDFAARVFVRTNDPAAAQFEIPIELHVRDVIPTDPPAYQFLAEATGMRIHLTLPTEPPAEGAIIERQDLRDEVWRVISDPLPPDEEGTLSFLDRSAEPSVDYAYRFRVRFRTGQLVLFGPYSVRYQPPRPDRLELFAISANPSREEVQLRLGLPATARTRVEVFDVRGRRIRQLRDELLAAGVHPVTWDGRVDSGARAVAGIYWVRADTGAEARTLRLVRLP